MRQKLLFPSGLTPRQRTMVPDLTVNLRSAPKTAGSPRLSAFVSEKCFFYNAPGTHCGWFTYLLDFNISHLVAAIQYSQPLFRAS